MAGVSLSILIVDDARLARLDAPTAAPAWPNAAPTSRIDPREVPPAPGPRTSTGPATPPRTPIGRVLDSALQRAASALIAESSRLTELDQAVGDGDLGASLTRGANAILEARTTWPLDDPSAALFALGMTLQRSLGGTSGPLYAVAFLRASALLKTEPNAWAEAFHAGCDAIGELGGAKPGDRTMLDALVPASEALTAARLAGSPPNEATRAAVAAAEAGAKATAALPPRKGRSSYLGDRALGHPDPGAEAVVVWLRAVAESLAEPGD